MPTNTIFVRDPKRRTTELGSLLEPVLKSEALTLGFRGSVFPRTNSGGVEELVVCAPDRSRPDNYREWRFPTSVDRVKGQYFEEWANVERDKWELKHLCFHLYLVVSRQEKPKEIIAIHSEPGEEGISLSSKLKKGPHLHVKAAGDPIGGAHFPLCLPCMDPVLASIDSLTDVMSELIKVIAQEIVSKH